MNWGEVYESRALSIAKNPRFETSTEAVKLYDELVKEYGQQRAQAVWMKACQTYDELHRDET